MTEQNKIRVLIVDDEPHARNRLKKLLASEKDFEISGECRNGKDAVQMIEKTKPDLVFLDVQMPVFDGFEVVKKVGAGAMPVVIFVTAYDQYALKAFDANALDYLLKPFDKKRFKISLKRAESLILNNRTALFNTRLVSMIGEQNQGSQQYLSRIVVRSTGRFYFVNTADIDWIEASDNYVILHIKSQTHLLRDTMTNLSSKLDPKAFLRIHRSTIINIARISEIKTMFNGEFAVLLDSGKELSTGKSYRENLASLLRN